MAVELWSKSGSSSTVVSTGGIPVAGTTTVTVQNPMTAANGIYIPSGGTSSVVGNYQIITFTGSGSFTPTQSGNVELLLVGGGGGGIASGGNPGISPGAGAGGLIYYGSTPYQYCQGTSIALVANTTYTVTIAGGGAVGSVSSGTVGGNSSVVGGSINLVAVGGAGARIGTAYYVASGAGGSIWGSAAWTTGNAAPNQGYQGGWCIAYVSGMSTVYYYEGGGGGTGGPGYGGIVNSTAVTTGGQGGPGFYTDISGSFAYYGAGGNGGMYNYGSSSRPQMPAASGIGGTSANATLSAASAVTNTGSGGGGSSTFSTTTGSGGSAGSSGVLIMRIPLYSTISVGNIANISTTGATVTTNGDYKTATFTGSGSFTVNNSQTNAIVEYLVVAGGGGGGFGDSTGTGGGGGGGGFLEWTWGVATGADFVGPKLAVNTGETYSVTVGSGGPGGTNAFSNATQIAQFGGNTSIACTSYASNAFYVRSLGGGAGGFGGGDNSTTTRKYHGGSGGSGGGKGAGGLFGFGESGTAVLSPRQGYSAYVAIGLSVSGSYTYGAGAGGPGVSSAGPGRASVINGSTYSAGGTINTTGTAGSANTGNGGSGTNNANNGGTGGSGIVVIRWKFQ